MEYNEKRKADRIENVWHEMGGNEVHIAHCRIEKRGSEASMRKYRRGKSKDVWKGMVGNRHFTEGNETKGTLGKDGVTEKERRAGGRVCGREWKAIKVNNKEKTLRRVGEEGQC